MASLSSDVQVTEAATKVVVDAAAPVKQNSTANTASPITELTLVGALLAGGVLLTIVLVFGRKARRRRQELEAEIAQLKAAA